jgi:hypothetical protein
LVAYCDGKRDPWQRPGYHGPSGATRGAIFGSAAPIDNLTTRGLDSRRLVAIRRSFGRHTPIRRRKFTRSATPSGGPHPTPRAKSDAAAVSMICFE